MIALRLIRTCFSRFSPKLVCLSRSRMCSSSTSELVVVPADCETRTVKSKFKANSKKFYTVSPTFVQDQRLNTRTCTSIEITPLSMVWAILDAEKDEITDCGSLPLVIDKKKCCPSHILEMALLVKEHLPTSDIYVMEDLASGHSKTNTNIQTLQIMISTLLSQNLKSDCIIHKVFYVNRLSLMKLFQIYVGTERVSSQPIIWKMIRKSPNGSAIPYSRERWDCIEDEVLPYTILNWSCETLIKKVWARDDVWRENVCNAILTACAMNDFAIKERTQALGAIWKPSK